MEQRASLGKPSIASRSTHVGGELIRFAHVRALCHAVGGSRQAPEIFEPSPAPERSPGRLSRRLPGRVRTSGSRRYGRSSASRAVSSADRVARNASRTSSRSVSVTRSELPPDPFPGTQGALGNFALGRQRKVSEGLIKRPGIGQCAAQVVPGRQLIGANPDSLLQIGDKLCRAGQRETEDPRSDHTYHSVKPTASK